MAAMSSLRAISTWCGVVRGVACPHGNRCYCRYSACFDLVQATMGRTDCCTACVRRHSLLTVLVWCSSVVAVHEVHPPHTQVTRCLNPNNIQRLCTTSCTVRTYISDAKPSTIIRSPMRPAIIQHADCACSSSTLLHSFPTLLPCFYQITNKTCHPITC